MALAPHPQAAGCRTAPAWIARSPDVRANLTPSQIVENLNKNSACADAELVNVADFANVAIFVILVFFSRT
jgi:hypothetical protein